METPYILDSNGANLQKSFVCYADILGYSKLSEEALKQGQGHKFLNELRTALTKAYDRIRENSNHFNIKQFFSVKVFTDNIVVGYPIQNIKSNHGEPELGDIFWTFAEFQAGLASEGFLIRGGIAFGDHYMDDDIVFGDALLEAVKFDKSGGPPRLTISSSAIKMIRKQLKSWGSAENSPYNQDLLEDADGSIFLSYLEWAFIAYPDGGVFLDLIQKHQETIIKGLTRYGGQPGIRSKYEWAASYHNYVCQNFMNKNPIPSNPDADEILVGATIEAQKLKGFLINIGSFIVSPRPISLIPF